MGTFINRVELKGNVGKDPKITEVGDRLVAKFSIATNEIFKDRAGTIKEETTWHNITAWSGKDNTDFEKIKKGTHLSVVGKIRNVRFTGQDGEEKYYNEIIASTLNFEEKGSE